VQYVPLVDAPSADAHVLIDHVYRLPLTFYGESDGWAEVAYVEWDLETELRTERSSVRGFVPSSALATWTMRDVFWCTAPPGTGDAWQQLDEERVLRLRWAPFDDARLLSWQQELIDLVRNRLPDR